jgi:hypothetical protein
MRARRTERPELAFLQHAQQLDLEHRAGIADLVEKDGAAVGLLEAAAAVFVGAGERTALVAKQLGFEQLVGQRTAVLDDERPCRRAGCSSGWRAPAFPCRYPTRR